MKNKTWKCECKIRVMNYPEVVFYGRKPFFIEPGPHKNALKKLGTFKENENGSLQYIGDSFFLDGNGNKVRIDEKGKINKTIEELNLTPERLAKIESQFE